MIKKEDLRVGDIFASKTITLKILEAMSTSITTKCLRGTTKDQIKERKGGKLDWFMWWVNCEAVRKID